MRDEDRTLPRTATGAGGREQARPERGRLRATVAGLVALSLLAGACGDDSADGATGDAASGGAGTAASTGATTSGPGSGSGAGNGNGGDGGSGDGTGGDPGGDEGAICRSASSLDIFDEDGLVDADRYRALAAAFATAPAVGYRFGADATAYHDTPESFPTAYQPDDHDFPHGDGQPYSTWQIGGPFEADPGGYNTSAGQALYVPDDPTRAGLDAIQFIEVSNAVASEKPQLTWTAYGEGAPDQSTAAAEMITAHGGPFRDAVAMARAQTTDQWTQDAIIAFQDGSLLTSGTHASGGSSNVLLRLPEGLVPTAVALTTNNELALVTVWDTANVRGGVAVVSLGGPANPGFWGDWNQLYPSLHSYGLFGFMKLLGVVWIDGMVAPVAISAAADVRWPMIGAPQPSSLDLSNESDRSRFMPGGDLAVRYATAGFAVVLSRSEKKVAYVDLQPVFDLVNRYYFGERADFEQTRDVGPAPDQWPFTFEVAPEGTPTVVSVTDFDSCPSAVATTLHVFAPHNFPDPDDDRHTHLSPTFGAHALVATEDGALHVLDVGGLHDDAPAEAAEIQEVYQVDVGRNPTAITALGRSVQAFGAPVDYAVVSRGDRRVTLLRGDPESSSLASYKTLTDSRLVDPIGVEDVTWFGNHIPLIEVADYAGRQVVAYRHEKAVLPFFGNREIPLGGDADFECGGSYPTAGGALFVSSTNVP